MSYEFGCGRGCLAGSVKSVTKTYRFRQCWYRPDEEGKCQPFRPVGYSEVIVEKSPDDRLCDVSFH
jgi:hypothetical protein